MPLLDLDDTSRKHATLAKPYPQPRPLNGPRPATQSTAAAATDVAAIEALLSLWDTGRVPPIEFIPLGGDKNLESFEDIPGPVDNESEEEGQGQEGVDKLQGGHALEDKDNDDERDKSESELEVNELYDSDGMLMRHV